MSYEFNALFVLASSPSIFIISALVYAIPEMLDAKILKRKGNMNRCTPFFCNTSKATTVHLTLRCRQTIKHRVGSMGSDFEAASKNAELLVMAFKIAPSRRLQ